MALKQCSRCADFKMTLNFAVSRSAPDGLQYYCKLCQQQYYREYIVLALRGRGKAHVLPEWLRGLVRPPVELPGKVIRLVDYINPVSNRKAKHLVVSG